MEKKVERRDKRVLFKATGMANEDGVGKGSSMYDAPYEDLDHQSTSYLTSRDARGKITSPLCKDEGQISSCQKEEGEEYVYYYLN